MMAHHHHHHHHATHIQTPLTTYPLTSITHTAYGPLTSITRTAYGPLTSITRTAYGPLTSITRTAYGPLTGITRIAYGPLTSITRTAYGPLISITCTAYGPPVSHQMHTPCTSLPPPPPCGQGYRDAQCAWLDVPLEALLLPSGCGSSSSCSCSAGSSNSGVRSQQRSPAAGTASVMPGGGGPVQAGTQDVGSCGCSCSSCRQSGVREAGRGGTCLVLAIYAPRRQLLELWVPQNGPRVALCQVCACVWGLSCP